MPLLFHDKELMELMQHFYVLTGMRIVLFDETYSELIAYPTNAKTFCNCMRENKAFYEKCCQSDARSFRQCRKTRSLTVFQCHAGLVEATAPIMENGKIIGYMMFGQITGQKNKEDFRAQLNDQCKEYKPSQDLGEQIKKIKYRSQKQIQAAAKILEACTGYIQLKEMVHLSEKRLVNLIEEFIDAHISEEITVNRLCKEFNLSRTRLYDLMRQYISGGIAAFIRQKRLQFAKHLIQTTDMPIAEIASAVGFTDYNYFLRVFKQAFGISPKKLTMLYNEMQ